MNHHSLDQIQNWMKTVLIERGSLKEKLETAASLDGVMIEQTVKGEGNMSAYRRLDIYAAGYVMRLVECLKSEFSLLCAYMGEEIFETFAKAYIVTVPSKNWSLYYLGAQFADFLRKTQPSELTDPEKAAVVAMPAQLALFERTRAEVMLAQGTEENPKVFDPKIGYDLSFLQGQLILQVPPCLRLLRLDYPILELVSSVEKSRDFKLPEKSECLLAITRINYQVVVSVLTRWQFLFLSRCTDPIAAHEVVKEVARNNNHEVNELIARLLLWLPVAEEKGLIMDGCIEKQTK